MPDPIRDTGDGGAPWAIARGREARNGDPRAGAATGGGDRGRRNDGGADGRGSGSHLKLN